MQIYSVKISDISAEKLSELCLIIDSEKKYKVMEFVNKKDKIRTLVGEMLIRTIIAENLKISYKSIKFSKNEYGKPYLKGYPQFNFNISHSGDYVLCAVDDKNIGIDIEEIKYIEYKEIAKTFFSAKEIGYIINHDLKCQLDRFYEMWTLKESYIKCCGQGLSIPLKSFSIEINQYENIKAITNNDYTEHTFRLLDIDPGYKVAVCSLNKELCSKVISVDQDYLINK